MDIIEAINSHRSIREYKPDPIPEELVKEILEAGIRASSSGNMQTYSIIVTRDQALREQLYVPHMEQNMVLDAPVLTRRTSVERTSPGARTELFISVSPLRRSPRGSFFLVPGGAGCCGERFGRLAGAREVHTMTIRRQRHLVGARRSGY